MLRDQNIILVNNTIEGLEILIRDATHNIAPWPRGWPYYTWASIV